MTSETCDRNCHLVAHTTGGYHRADCGAYAAHAAEIERQVASQRTVTIEIRCTPEGAARLQYMALASGGLTVDKANAPAPMIEVLP